MESITDYDQYHVLRGYTYMWRMRLFSCGLQTRSGVSGCMRTGAADMLFLLFGFSKKLSMLAPIFGVNQFFLVFLFVFEQFTTTNN